jgi:hypothetical protein
LVEKERVLVVAVLHGHRAASRTQRPAIGVDRVAEQRDGADEGRLEAYGSIVVGSVIVNHGEVVRPSQLIASVGRTIAGATAANEHV